MEEPESEMESETPQPQVEEPIDKPKQGIHCLICRVDDEESLNVQGGQIEGPEENDKIFNLLCNSLNIKISRKNSWDFKTESLPFCSSCLEISRDILEIQENIRILEKQFKVKVGDLRNLILDSEPKKCDEIDKRFKYFRKQVIGNNKADRKESKKSKKSPPQQLKVKKLSTLLEEESTITTRRRSERVTQKVESVKVIPDLSYFEDSDQEFDNDEYQNQDSNDDKDLDYFYPVEHVEAVDNYSADIKPFVDIKQEFEPELELEPEVPSSEPFIPGLQIEPTSSSALNNLRPSRLRTPRKRPVSKSPTRKKSKKSDCEADSDSEDSSDNDSDFAAGKSADDKDSSDSEEEKSDKKGRKSSRSGVRKWKSCKRTGKLWYDGTEIIRVKNGLRCSECDEVVEGDKKWVNKSKIKRHILSKHTEKLPCHLCEKTLSSQKYLNLHIKAVHEKSLIIPCHICEKPFTSVNAMRRHAWDHQSEEEKQAAIAAGKKKYGSGCKNAKEALLQCSTCGKLCKGQSSLKSHEETHIDESQRPKHMCQVCGGLYTGPSSLKSHIRRQHDNNNRLQWLQCPHCDKKYPNRSQLELHVRFHTGEKPFKCAECGAGFNTTRLLKNHMLKHKNLRPHKCVDCDMSFFQKYHLRRHREVYHERANPPTRKQPYRSENGTRKAPQKRSKTSIPKRETNPAEPLLREVKPSRPSVPTEMAKLSNQYQPHSIFGSLKASRPAVPATTETVKPQSQYQPHSMVGGCGPGSYYDMQQLLQWPPLGNNMSHNNSHHNEPPTSPDDVSYPRSSSCSYPFDYSSTGTGRD